jgi:hypothetical protein
MLLRHIGWRQPNASHCAAHAPGCAFSNKCATIKCNRHLAMKIDPSASAGMTGVTGMRIIRAIVAGECAPDTLAEMRDIRCHASVETTCAALSWNWRDEHVFALCQSLALYDFYQTKILECDRKLEVALKALEDGMGHDTGRLPKVRTKTRQVNTPDFEVCSALYRVLGLETICRVMRVSARGYRSWRARPASARSRGDRRVLTHIREQYSLSLGSAVYAERPPCGQSKGPPSHDNGAQGGGPRW